jgi:hypothetical protein
MYNKEFIYNELKIKVVLKNIEDSFIDKHHVEIVSIDAFDKDTNKQVDYEKLSERDQLNIEQTIWRFV